MPEAGPRTLVLGGGLTGLLAAWHLQQHGAPVEVWEAGEEPGGWARTLPWPGPAGEPGWLERGPQALQVVDGEALDDLRNELGLGALPRGPRGPRWLGRGGTRHPSPATLRGLLAAPGLDPLERLRLLAEPLVGPSPRQDEDLAAWMSRRLGPGFTRAWLPALTAGVLAAPPEAVGLEALPRLRRLEARGGLLRGTLRLGAPRTWVPPGGVGALALALAARTPGLRLGRAALDLRPGPKGGWRVAWAEGEVEVEHVVLALPSNRAARLLAAAAPEAAGRLAALPRLSLSIWHSRHAPIPDWTRGFGLLVHPPEGRGLLGAVSLAADDPRGVPGLLQVRTYLGGAYPVDPELAAWPGIFAELRRWLPELPEAVQVREVACPEAFPLLGPGHGAVLRDILHALPSGLHCLGTARFGPGVPDLAMGVADWARELGPTSG